MHEQVVHRLNVLGKKSHCADPLLMEHSGARRFRRPGADMFGGWYEANRPAAAMFLPKAKRNDETRNASSDPASRAATRWVSRPGFQDSNPARRGICMAYDSGVFRGLKLALSRTAHRKLFALCIFADGAIGRPLAAMASSEDLSPPHREDECIDC
jgi:hypothetical protein